MRIVKKMIILCLGIILIGCNSKESPNIESSQASNSGSNSIDQNLTDPILKDKVLGMLIGSAIGDAWGAPTEMWTRADIVKEHGYISKLGPLFREPSPEGPWYKNLPPGGTTDDTRWKSLMVDYFENVKPKSIDKEDLNAKDFADFIMGAYKDELTRLKSTEGFEPGPYEMNMRRVNWLQEWALVARALSENNAEEYGNRLSKFYGGEMACAGMLYAPMVGLYYPGKPKIAYEEMYKLSIFDIGYAKDISALTAALTAEAMAADPSKKDLFDSFISVDPEAYFDARLIGRATYRIYEDAKRIVEEAQTVSLKDWNEMNVEMSSNFPYDSLYFLQLEKAFQLLDNKNQDIAFHAGEIHLINITALLFTELDFVKALEFVTNYGRDNDTVGAITGAVLGAYYGAENIPSYLKDPVTQVSTEKLEIDLNNLADRVAEILSKTFVIIKAENEDYWCYLRIEVLT